MSTTFFIIHIIILTFLVVRWGGMEILLSPPRFLFFANCVYFFLIYFLFSNIDSQAKIYASKVATVFLFSFLFIDWLLYRIGLNGRRFLQGRVKIITCTSGIYYLYFTVVLGGIYMSANDLDTFIPLEAFSRSYLVTEGNEPEAGSYIFTLVYAPFLWFLYIMALYKTMSINNNKRRNFIVLSLIFSCTYYGAFSGSKSTLLLPTIYWFFLYIVSSMKDRDMLKAREYSFSGALMLSRGSLKAIFLTIFISVAVAYLLVFLNEIRSSYITGEDFMTSFLSRIDFIPTLAGYLSNHENFSSQWPPQELIKDFIPSSLAKWIHVEKHRISFDVLYTQFAYCDFRLSSSAGVGIAAINETLKPLSLNIPYFSACVAGALSAYFTAFTNRVLVTERMYQGVFWFACMVPSFHIIAFFEPGPTLFFRFIFSVFLLAVVVSPLLIFLRVLKIRRYQWNV